MCVQEYVYIVHKIYRLPAEKDKLYALVYCNV